uniref:Dynein regulatory complex protein 1/2 N-terminal domain-containing protein n=1 Tax=Glossina palpalis gambiensis TaxID=67801 RepID=A0A1B0BCR6_9MUSC
MAAAAATTDATLPAIGQQITIDAPMYITDEDLAPPPPPPKKKKPTKAELMERRKQEEIEFKQLEMREELKRELAMSKKTAEKGQKEWEEMCKEIKIKELRSELEEWEIKTSRILKQKDDKIALLIDDMIVTEEMHKRNYSAQMQVMEFLSGRRLKFVSFFAKKKKINIMKSRLDAMRAFHETANLLYETQTSDMVHEYYDEIKDREQVTNDIKVKCENVMHANNVVVENQMLSDYQIFLDKRDDRVNTEIEKRYRLRDSIISNMRFLHKQLTTFLESLRNASLDVRKYERVNMLMERQKNFVIESQKLNDVEARSSRIYMDLQRDMLHIGADAQRKIKDLRLEHAYFVQMRKNIETEMKQDRQETYEKLKILTFHCFETNKKYKKLKKYGELLLSLAANCRKLQTESEKVVPWGDFEKPIDIEDDKIEFKLNVLDLKTHVDLDEEVRISFHSFLCLSFTYISYSLSHRKELDAQIELMSTFWRRQAIAEAQIVLLTEKKMKLELENQKYINKIKRMSKVDDVAELTKTLTVDCVLPERKVPRPRCKASMFTRPP